MTRQMFKIRCSEPALDLAYGFMTDLRYGNRLGIDPGNYSTQDFGSITLRAWRRADGGIRILEIERGLA